MDYPRLILLEKRLLRFDPRQVPAAVQIEQLLQAHSADCALAWLVTAYEHRMNFGQVCRFADLVTSTRRHMTAQVEAFMRFSQQGVMPTFYQGDLQLGNLFFLVNRASVFQDDHEQLAFMQCARMLSLHNPHVITARTQIIAIIRDLICQLRIRPVQEENSESILQNKEEAMMAAATNYMQTLQMMSITTHRIITTSFANSHSFL